MDPTRHGGRHQRGPGPHCGHDRLGNPEDLAAYLARMEGEDRLAWQQPDEVIRAMGVKRGDRVCDVGAGPGFFALRLARAVGPQGEVYAFEADPRILEVLRQRVRQHGLFNVQPMLAEEGLPPRPCDLILIVNTFHHFRDGPGYLRMLAARLKPGGRLVNVDFHRREMPVGPPLEHKVAREDFLAAAAQAGLAVAAEHHLLPYQYFLVLRLAAEEPARRAARARRPAGKPASSRPGKAGRGGRRARKIRPGKGRKIRLDKRRKIRPDKRRKSRPRPR